MANLSKNALKVLAVLADYSMHDKQPRSTVDARTQLGGLALDTAESELKKAGKIEVDDTGQFELTDDGRNDVRSDPKRFMAIVKDLQCRNEVNKEEASKRSSWTVRALLISAAVLLGIAMLKAWPSQANDPMWWYLGSLVMIVGLVVIGGVFAKMNRGIRQQNLQGNRDHADRRARHPVGDLHGQFARFSPRCARHHCRVSVRQRQFIR